VEPRRRRRPARLWLDLRRRARLDLIPPRWQCSLPTLNWLYGDQASVGLSRIAAAAAEAGFDALGLDTVSVDRFAGSGDRSDRAGRLLRDHGLTCSDVGVLVADDPDALANAASLAELASATGARLCLVVFEERPTAGSLAALDDCSAVLREAGVRLALEFVAYTGIQTLADAVDVCATVGWERCGVLLDSWHFFRGGAAWGALGALGGAQLALVHVSDGGPSAGDPVHESRNERLPAGQGGFAMGELARTLADLGYAGVVSAEVLSRQLRALPPDAAARVLMTSLRTFARSARS
jgi:sugar phosphate isomerase/epimerase